MKLQPRKQCLVIAVAFSFMLEYLLVGPAAAGPVASTPPYVAHAPITIDGNRAFTAENGVAGGSGTPSDPYVIEGWKITPSTADANRIWNTDAYFIIRNVYAYSSGREYVFPNGIYLYSVANGVLEDNVIEGLYTGAGIWYSTDITVQRNTISGSGLGGILLCHSGKSEVIGNNVRGNGNGILLIRSYDSVIRANEVVNDGVGVHLLDSQDAVVYGNNLLANGVQAEDSKGLRNAWDRGYPQGGNYWSDYPGVDEKGGSDQATPSSPDNIGDSPMVFMGGEDRYPSMTALPSPTPPPESPFLLYPPPDWTAYALPTVSLGTVALALFAGFVAWRVQRASGPSQGQPRPRVRGTEPG